MTSFHIQDNSHYLRLQAHILSHSMTTMARDDPCAIMKFFSPSIVIPLLRIPLTVGNLGSSLTERERERGGGGTERERRGRGLDSGG